MGRVSATEFPAVNGNVDPLESCGRKYISEYWAKKDLRYHPYRVGRVGRAEIAREA